MDARHVRVLVAEQHRIVEQVHEERVVGLEDQQLAVAIDGDGKLLIFEADNALIIHLLDDPELYGYKHRYVPRILAALDALVRRRIAAQPPARDAR